MKETLAQELREAARALQKCTEEQHCYSVIQDIVSLACDHISVRARISEVNTNGAEYSNKS